MPKMNTQNIPPNLAVKKIPHILNLCGSGIPRTCHYGTAQYLPNASALYNFFHFADHRGERALDPNDSFGIVRAGESGHILGDGEVSVEWPFHEDAFSGDDARFYGQEVLVDADAADD
jgi:hypothetical protein